MAFQENQKQEIINKFKTSDNDTGSPEVQIALLTARIQYLTQHFSAFKKEPSISVLLKKTITQEEVLSGRSIRDGSFWII